MIFMTLINFAVEHIKTIVIAALLVWFSFLIYIVGSSRGAEEVQKRFDNYVIQQSHELENLRYKYNRLSGDYEKARAARQSATRTITKEVIREVEKPVYRECVIPDDGVRLLNDARKGTSSTSEPAAAVPGDPAAPEGGDHG